MSVFNLDNRRSRPEQIPLAPRFAPTCRCADGDVIAYRDEDGDWTCSSCGRLFSGSDAHEEARLARAA